MSCALDTVLDRIEGVVQRVYFTNIQSIHPDAIVIAHKVTDACRAMKQIPSLKDIPVVFLSAKGQDSEIQTGLDAGAEEYLLKPFAPDQLVERVKAILAKFGK